MKTFSQRKGLKPVPELLQTDSMNDDLRVSLWNALHSFVWAVPGFLHGPGGRMGSAVMGWIGRFSHQLWFHHFKLPVDKRPQTPKAILDEIRSHFFKCTWAEVYDFLEFVVEHTSDRVRNLEESLNQILERELSGYRFVSGVLTDITSKEEMDMLAEALKDTKFAGVTAHINQSLVLYSNREMPDYRNSIKESISAVEAMAQIVSSQPKATLGDALKALEKQGALHPSLKDGFLKLYGYTSDEGGIRHAMSDVPDLGAADARYFLVSCSAFVNYLKAQL